MARTRQNSKFGLNDLAAASLWRRKRKSVIALLSVALASTLVTALVTVYGGVERGVSRQFRDFGPNLILAPAKHGEWLTQKDAGVVKNTLGPGIPWAGITYAVARIRSGNGRWHTIAMAGAQWQSMRRLNPAWRVSRGSDSASSSIGVQSGTPVWLGAQAARALRLKPGDLLTLGYGGRTAQCRTAGIVTSGGEADDQVFAPLAAVRRLTGIQGYTTVEIAAPASEIRLLTLRLRRLLPRAAISPVRQIAAGEGDLLLRTRGLLLWSALVILLTLALCGIATLAGLAIERRKEFGIMKAIGAGNRQVLTQFAMEALALGAAGGGLGLIAGAAIARGVGEAAYGTALSPSAMALFLGLAVGLGLAFMAGLAPFPMIMQAHPAEILRGE